MLCVRCGQPSLDTLLMGGKVSYLCKNCGFHSGRATVIDELKVEYLDGGRIKHFSVGAVITRGDEFLIIKKRVWPYQYSIVAGHMNKTETPKQTLSREVIEEIGVAPVNIKLIVHEPNLDGDKCRKGADIHEWFLFGCDVDYGSIINNPEESDRVLWVKQREANNLKFTFAADYMLHKIGFLSTE